MASLVKIVWYLSALSIATCKVSTRESEGYPVGFLSVCPGSNKTAEISQNSLKHLQFILINDGFFITSFFNKTAYNYFNMKELARHLDFNKKTVLYMPGYVDSNYLTIVGPTMGSVYKKLGYNVILLEYVHFSAVVYPRAARLLRPVGRHAAEMLAALTKLGLNPAKLELLGVSHGGQGISFIAKNYRRITGMHISRVTSLDPAGPCFRNNGPDERIDASDADFVDIIHTNIDGYGLAAPVGHVDFYVNGGEFQPGDFRTLPCTALCSHTRAFTLWMGALFNPDSFMGMQCDSVQDARDRNCFEREPFVTNVIGPKTDRSKQGIFYVMSHNEFPYAMGVSGLKRKNEPYNWYTSKYNEDDVLVE